MSSSADAASVSTPSRRPLEAELRWRHALLIVLASATLLARGDGGDWPYFRLMAKDTFESDGARIYVFHPSLQTGPVTLVVVRLLSAAGGLQVRHLFFATLGVATLFSLQAIRDEARCRRLARIDPVLIAGGLILMLWWGYLRAFGHVDDAMVIALAAAALLLVTRGKPLPAAALIGITFAVKPWAIFLLPMTFLSGTSRGTGTELVRRRLAGPLVSAAVGLVLWAPFLIAEPGTLRSLRPPQSLAKDSVLRLFGYGSTALPTGLRVAQLCVAVMIVSAAVWRGRWSGAILAGAATRLALDPATWNYYTATFVFGALVWDVFESEQVPWATLAATILVLPDWVTDAARFRAALRLIACVGALVLVFQPRRAASAAVSEPARSGDRSRPTPDRSAFG